MHLVQHFTYISLQLHIHGHWAGALYPSCLCAGVQKDKSRKGELWGLENLLKLTEGSVRTQQYVSNPAQDMESFNIVDFDTGAAMLLPWLRGVRCC